MRTKRTTHRGKKWREKVTIHGKPVNVSAKLNFNSYSEIDLSDG